MTKRSSNGEACVLMIPSSRVPPALKLAAAAAEQHESPPAVAATKLPPKQSLLKALLEWVDQCQYDCKKCDFKAKSKAAFIHHIRVTHGLQPETYTKIYGSGLASTEKMYRCKICEVMVRHTKPSIETHLKECHGDRCASLLEYFKGHHYRKGYSREGTLGGGEEEEEYPANTDFPCQYGECDKMFASEDDLKGHVEDMHCSLVEYLKRYKEFKMPLEKYKVLSDDATSPPPEQETPKQPTRSTRSSKRKSVLRKDIIVGSSSPAGSGQDSKSAEAACPPPEDENKTEETTAETHSESTSDELATLNNVSRRTLALKSQETGAALLRDEFENELDEEIAAATAAVAAEEEEKPKPAKREKVDPDLEAAISEYQKRNGMTEKSDTESLEGSSSSGQKAKFKDYFKDHIKRSYTQEDLESAISAVQQGHGVCDASRRNGVPVSTLRDHLHSRGVDYPRLNRDEYKSKYDEADLEEAFEAVRNGMSVAEAARTNNLPSSTLRDQLKKAGIGYSKINPKRKYTPEDLEAAIEDIKNNGYTIADASRQYGIPTSSLGDKLKARGIAYGSVSKKARKRSRSVTEDEEEQDNQWTVEPLVTLVTEKSPPAAAASPVEPLDAAIEDVKNGMSISDAATEHSVPRRTLEFHVRKRRITTVPKPDVSNEDSSDSSSMTSRFKRGSDEAIMSRKLTVGGSYKNYTDEQFKAAVEDVKAGVRVKVAAKKHGVPVTTLNENVPKSERPRILEKRASRSPTPTQPGDSSVEGGITMTREDIFNYAVEDVKSGLAVTQTAKKWDIPQTTLYDRIHALGIDLQSPEIVNKRRIIARASQGDGSSSSYRGHDIILDPNLKKDAIKRALVDIEAGMSVPQASKKHNVTSSSLYYYVNRQQEAEAMENAKMDINQVTFETVQSDSDGEEKEVDVESDEDGNKVTRHTLMKAVSDVMVKGMEVPKAAEKHVVSEADLIAKIEEVKANGGQASLLIPKKYRKYPTEAFDLAIADVKKGMTVTDAARKHQVPRNTLDDRVKKLGIPVTTHVTMDPSQYRGSRGAWLPPSDVKPDAANELHTTLDIEEFNPVECNVEMEEIETKPCLKTLNIGARNIEGSAAPPARPLLVYLGNKSKGPVSKELWNRLVENMICAVFIEEAKFIEAWEALPDPKSSAPQSISIKSYGHCSDHGFIIPCDVDSHNRIAKIIDVLTVGADRFKAWPVDSLPQTVALWIKIPVAFVKQVDPASLFRTVHYKNGWSVGQATYVACEVLRDGKHVAMKFLATEDLLKHILFGQESQVKVNITTAQVYCEEEKLTTDTKVEFKYRG